MTKLHLGCGRKYLEGYINIDLSSNNQTIQKDLIIDLNADIATLKYDNCTIDEIRLHHVFEHFSRPVALALLCRWRNWLLPGGVLRIETPDAMACYRSMLSPFISFKNKQQVMRHLFGSHEAPWAFHKDGWYEKKFKVTLTKLGFTKIKIIKTKWEMLRNIEVIAVKSEATFHLADFERAVEELLRMSAIRLTLNEQKIVPESEVDQISVWMKLWKVTYEL